MTSQIYYLYSVIAALIPTIILISRKFSRRLYSKLNTQYFRHNYLQFYNLNVLFTMVLSEYYLKNLRASVAYIFPEYFNNYFSFILVMAMVNMVLCKIISDITIKYDINELSIKENKIL